MGRRRCRTWWRAAAATAFARSPRTPNGQPLRAPLVIQQPDATAGTDKVVLENYDGDHYGFLRITATAALLRIEFHPADGSSSKAASDSVTIDLATRMFMHYAV